MSQPPNPLAEYQSYSYHHILMATNVTDVYNQMCVAGADAANATSDFTDEILSLRPEDDRYKPLNIFGGQLVVIIDSRIDSRFFIDDVVIEQMLQGSGDNVSMSSVEASMKISEPISSGLFILILRQVIESLGTNPLTTTFILKTLFYGYKTDGTVDSLTTTRPFGFTIDELSGEFTSAGSEYEVKMLGIVNGAALSPQLSSIKGLVGGVTIETSTKVVDVLTDLQDQVNAAYQKRAVKPLEDQLKENQELATNITLIQYRITWDAELDNPAYTVSDVLANATPGGGKLAKGGLIKFGESESDVYGAITKIVNSSEQVAKDAAQEANKAVFVWELTNSKNTQPDGSLEIHVHISKKTVKKEPVVKTANEKDQEKLAKEAAAQKEAAGRAVTNEFIDKVNSSTGLRSTPEITPYTVTAPTPATPLVPDIDGMLILDYLYSGKNVDVLKFDMNLDNLVVFLQPSSIGTNMPQADGMQARLNGKGTLNPVKTSPMGTGTVLAVPTQPTKASNKQSTMPATRQSLMMELSTFAAESQFDVYITIMGNPLFFGAMMVPPSQLGQLKWHKQPYRVKVNTFGMEPDEQELYPFWYTGTYRIYVVKHMFSNGQFTQELEMFPELEEQQITQPVDEPQVKRAGTPVPLAPQTKEAYVNTGECYVTPPAGQHLEQYFVKYSEMYGIPCGVLSRMCEVESSYLPQVTENKSGAAGYMQIVYYYTTNGVRTGGSPHPDSRFWPPAKGKFDRLNPDQAIEYAARMMKFLKNADRYKFNWSQVIAAYNTGEGNVETAMKAHGPNWHRHMAQEAVNYVAFFQQTCSAQIGDVNAPWK